MPRRNDIAKILIIGWLFVSGVQAQQEDSSRITFGSTQDAAQLFDVDRGIVLPHHSLTMRFSSYSVSDIDVQAHPLDGCRYARTVGEGRLLQVVTDDEGKFAVGGISAGRYLVQVKAEGFPLFTDCMIVGNAAESQACKLSPIPNSSYFRVSRTLPFFPGDILEGGCRQWIPQPCASLHAEKGGQALSSSHVKLVYLDGSTVPNAMITLLGYASKKGSVRAKNPQPNRKIGSVQANGEGLADLTALLNAGGPGRGKLMIGNLRDKESTSEIFDMHQAQDAPAQTLVVFQRGCRSKQFWDIEVLQANAP